MNLDDTDRAILEVLLEDARTSQRALARRVGIAQGTVLNRLRSCLLYTSPSPRDATLSRMPSSA